MFLKVVRGLDYLEANMVEVEDLAVMEALEY